MSDGREARIFRWAQAYLARRGYVYRFQWEIYDRLLRKSVPADGVWIDLGCGDNRWLERVQARVRLGIDVGIHDGLRDSTFAQGSVYELPFANESVDALSARFVVEHLSDPIAFFAESARVLKPGGSLVIQTTNVMSPLLFLASKVPYAFRRWFTGRLFRVRETDVFPTYYRFNSPDLYRETIHGLVPKQVVLHSGVSLSRPWLFLLGYYYERATDRPLLERFKMNISAVYKRV